MTPEISINENTEHAHQKTLIDPHSPSSLASKIESLGTINASTHTPAYTMHKFWARRPWKLFRKLVEEFTRPGDIVLDPFAGGGVVLVEGLVARRRIVAVDINPLAAFVMRHEVEPLELELFKRAAEAVVEETRPLAERLYAVRCPCCRGSAMALWTEYDSADERPLRISYTCPRCGAKGEKQPEHHDLPSPSEPPPIKRLEIARGDKTEDLLKRGLRFYDELFTARNLHMLTGIKEAIRRICFHNGLRGVESFLNFTLSSTLKWASRMSHLRGRVLEGWAMHAYWVYPRHVEVNVWLQFQNRARAVVRGKEYTNTHIGAYARRAKTFEELLDGATYMVLNRDARSLPIPSSSVEAVITDPPYGDNVNYAELSDYFLWIFGGSAPKEGEIVINRARNFTLERYEAGLREAFRECARVLKPPGLMVSTFNSKDASIVASFVKAAREAGFRFAAASLQPYLRAYQTTFHALQVDSMPFDIVFFFQRDLKCSCPPPTLADLSEKIEKHLKLCKEEGQTERMFRITVYPELISYLAHAPLGQLHPAALLLEKTVQREREYFREARAKALNRRRANVGDSGEDAARA